MSLLFPKAEDWVSFKIQTDLHPCSGRTKMTLNSKQHGKYQCKTTFVHDTFPWIFSMLEVSVILYHWRFNNRLLDHTLSEDPWMAMRYYCKCRRQPWQSPLHAEAQGCQWIPQPATLAKERTQNLGMGGSFMFSRKYGPNKRKKHAPETCRCTIRKSVLIHLSSMPTNARNLPVGLRIDNALPLRFKNLFSLFSSSRCKQDIGHGQDRPGPLFLK